MREADKLAEGSVSVASTLSTMKSKNYCAAACLVSRRLWVEAVGMPFTLFEIQWGYFGAGNPFVTDVEKRNNFSTSGECQTR
jgi:hypothetical protein